MNANRHSTQTPGLVDSLFNMFKPNATAGTKRPRSGSTADLTGKNERRDEKKKSRAPLGEVTNTIYGGGGGGTKEQVAKSTHSMTTRGRRAEAKDTCQIVPKTFGDDTAAAQRVAQAARGPSAPSSTNGVVMSHNAKQVIIQQHNQPKPPCADPMECSPSPLKRQRPNTHRPTSPSVRIPPKGGVSNVSNTGFPPPSLTSINCLPSKQSSIGVDNHHTQGYAEHQSELLDISPASSVSPASSLSLSPASPCTTSPSCKSDYRATHEAAPLQLYDIDAKPDATDTFCHEYAEDIFEHLRASEDRYRPDNFDMTSVQRDISCNMRSILMDWLVEVCEEYKLCQQTLYLTKNFIDRFLSRKLVERGHLQLVGITAMLLAAKHEEIYPPSIDDFVYISDNTYSNEQVLEMEAIMLDVLEFNLCPPTERNFLKRFHRAAAATLPSAKLINSVSYLSDYFSELTLVEYEFVKFKPSIIAAASVCLALHTLNQQTWTPTLEHYSTYSLQNPTFMEATRMLFDLHKKAHSGALTLRAVVEKYKHPRYWCASSFAPRG